MGLLEKATLVEKLYGAASSEYLASGARRSL